MSLPPNLALEIVTPERPLVQETVDEVAMPGSEGELGVLPGHTPLLTTLKPGVLWYRQGDVKHYVAVGQGFAEVLPDRVTVLTQVADRAEEIEVARAEEAKQRAEQRLATPGPETDLAMAQEALAMASARLQAATRARARA